MPDTTIENAFVMLCDWRGVIVWSSRLNRHRIGDIAWKYLTPESMERAKANHAKVASLRQKRTLDVENADGERFRCWLWPLESPEIAVCVLGMEVPAALSQLTDREAECLTMLAQGIETRIIARQLNVSISTVHTHLKRAREKLGLPNVESLISFAARYCYPRAMPLCDGAAGKPAT